MNEKELREKTNSKNTAELVKAVKALTGEFSKTTKDIKNTPKKGLVGAILGNVAPGLSGLKNLRKGSGMMDALASRAGGGFVSTVLGTAAEHLRNKEADKEDKVKWASGLLAGTGKGRGMVKEMGIAGASKEALKLYDKKLAIERAIYEIELKRSKLKDSGVEGADITDEDAAKLGEHKQALKDLTKEPEVVSPVQAPITKPGAEHALTKDDIADFFVDKAAHEARSHITDPKEHDEFVEGVRKGVEEELLNTSKEQLDELRALVKSMTKTEEDKYESDVSKNKANIDSKEDRSKKSKSITNDVIKPEGEGGISKMLGTFVEGLGALLPVLAVVAAMLGVTGAAKYGGEHARELTQPGSNLDAIQKSVGGDGLKARGDMNSAEGLDADTKQHWWDAVGGKTDRMKKKYADQIESGAQFTKEEAAVLKKNLGIDVPTQNIKPSVIPAETPPSAEPVSQKPEVEAPKPIRVEQTEQLKDKTDEAKAAEKQDNTPAQSVPVTSVVNNNSSTTMVVRPEVRTSEPSISRALRMNFA